MGAVGSSAICVTAGAGVFLTGGSLLSGGFLLPVGGVAAIWSYLALGSYQDQEQKSQDLKEKLDSLQEKGSNLDDVTHEIKGKTHTKVSQHAESVKVRESPYLRDLKETMKEIFKILIENGNYNEVRKLVEERDLQTVGAK